ncbi:substrate-binding domain-containing protein, partial [Clostridioides difficile]|nr:substrate-binding domain-containing protein [Clostridioides difficile]NJA49423.1 solute-binding protein [Clostridioides difficile]
ITYPVSVIKASKNVDAAKKFEEFLLSESGQKIFEEFGYKKVE